MPSDTVPNPTKKIPLPLSETSEGVSQATTSDTTQETPLPRTLESDSQTEVRNNESSYPNDLENIVSIDTIVLEINTLNEEKELLARTLEAKTLEVQPLEAKIAKLEKKLSSITTVFMEERETVKKERLELMQAIEEGIKELALANEKLQETVESLKDKQQEVSNLKNQLETEIKEHESKIDKLTQTHASEIADLREKHTNSLKQVLEAKNRGQEKLEEKNRELNFSDLQLRTLSNKINGLEDIITAKEKQIQKLLVKKPEGTHASTQIEGALPINKSVTQSPTDLENPEKPSIMSIIRGNNTITKRVAAMPDRNHPVQNSKQPSSDSAQHTSDPQPHSPHVLIDTLQQSASRSYQGQGTRTPSPNNSSGESAQSPPLSQSEKYSNASRHVISSNDEEEGEGEIMPNLGISQAGLNQQLWVIEDLEKELAFTKVKRHNLIHFKSVLKNFYAKNAGEKCDKEIQRTNTIKTQKDLESAQVKLDFSQDILINRTSKLLQSYSNLKQNIDQLIDLRRSNSNENTELQIKELESASEKQNILITTQKKLNEQTATLDTSHKKQLVSIQLVSILKIQQSDSRFSLSVELCTLQLRLQSLESHFVKLQEGLQKQQLELLENQQALCTKGLFRNNLAAMQLTLQKSQMELQNQQLRLQQFRDQLNKMQAQNLALSSEESEEHAHLQPTPEISELKQELNNRYTNNFARCITDKLREENEKNCATHIRECDLQIIFFKEKILDMLDLSPFVNNYNLAEFEKNVRGTLNFVRHFEALGTDLYDVNPHATRQVLENQITNLSTILDDLKKETYQKRLNALVISRNRQEQEEKFSEDEIKYFLNSNYKYPEGGIFIDDPKDQSPIIDPTKLTTYHRMANKKLNKQELDNCITTLEEIIKNKAYIEGYLSSVKFKKNDLETKLFCSAATEPLGPKLIISTSNTRHRSINDSKSLELEVARSALYKDLKNSSSSITIRYEDVSMPYEEVTLADSSETLIAINGGDDVIGLIIKSKSNKTHELIIDSVDGEKVTDFKKLSPKAKVTAVLALTQATLQIVDKNKIAWIEIDGTKKHEWMHHYVELKAQKIAFPYTGNSIIIVKGNPGNSLLLDPKMSDNFNKAIDKRVKQLEAQKISKIPKSHKKLVTDENKSVISKVKSSIFKNTELESGYDSDEEPISSYLPGARSM